jgi:hypothetical protein
MIEDMVGEWAVIRKGDTYLENTQPNPFLPLTE